MNLLETRNKRRHSGLPLENWRCNMRASLRKSVVGSLAALALGISTVAAVAPASAQTQGQSSWKNGQPNVPHGPGGNHMGGGNGGGHWHHDHDGGWGAAAVGLGVLGLAAGAAAASQGPYYEDQPDPGCTEYHDVYDAYGNYRGRRLVNVC
jgi:hypothetical protein